MRKIIRIGIPRKTKPMYKRANSNSPVLKHIRFYPYRSLFTVENDSTALGVCGRRPDKTPEAALIVLKNVWFENKLLLWND